MVQLTDEELKQLILNGSLCPYPRPFYQPHDYNAAEVEEIMSLSPDQQHAWLIEKRKKRAALIATLSGYVS